jgi:hypothetical protein
VWQGFGWIDQPEAKIGWWKHGPGCFAFDEFENADHLVTHWMEIADPTQAKEAKPRHPQSSERRCAVIQFRTLTEAISAAQQGSTVCWKTGAYQLRQDKNGKWFVHCSITNDWASLFWADGVTSSYKPEDFFNAGSL